ncbi:MAG: flagellar biosynthetic protein FliO [Acidimicrobiia bacterium]|nr:flagellar biosynthetic protein FliO [Acidimicrobiia bacterium]
MQSVSTFSLFLRLALSLAVVLGLMALAASFLRRRGVSVGRRTQGGPRVDVLARRGLSRGASVAVVRVAGRHLVVGVTDQSITVLAETDQESIDLDAEAARTPPPGSQDPGSRPAWKALLDAMRERTVRRR